MNDEDKETLRSVFAGLSALAYIMRGVPDSEVPKMAYEMADRLLEASEPKVEIGIPAIRKRKAQ